MFILLYVEQLLMHNDIQQRDAIYNMQKIWFISIKYLLLNN